LKDLAEKLPGGCQNKPLQELINLLGQHYREEPLPALFTGWNLLQKSGLSPHERSTIIATSSVQISTQLASNATAAQRRMRALRLSFIEESLRTQWQDEELFARDERQALKDEQRGKVRKNHGYAAIYSDEDSDGNDSGLSAKSEEINHAQGDENHEEESNSESEFEDALYMLDRLEEQDEDRKSLEEALSLMHDARSKRRSAQRTFVQARAVVRDIKRTRRLFRPRPKKGAHAATNLSSKIRSRATSNPPPTKG
jgi:hypothetical protein